MHDFLSMAVHNKFYICTTKQASEAVTYFHIQNGNEKMLLQVF